MLVGEKLLIGVQTRFLNQR